MKGVVGKFFLQFGVTLCVAVLLSYLEAITLAPARCAQLLTPRTPSATRLGRLRRPRLRRPGARLRLGCWRGALRRPGWCCWPAAACCWSAPVFVLRATAERVRAVAGPEPAHACACRPRSGSNLEETDQLLQRAEAFVMRRPEVRAPFAVVGGFGGGGVNTGMMFITLKPPDERKLTQAEFTARAAQASSTLSPACAPSSRTCRSGLHRRSAASRSSSRCAAPTGTSWSSSSPEHAREADRAPGTVVDVDTDYQLGMPELRITPDRARAADLGRLGRGRRDHPQRAGRRRARRQVHLRRPARRRARCGCWPTSARGPRTWPAARAHRAAASWCRCRRWSRLEERPALQAITRRDRERAITIFGNVAPGHSQDEALAAVEQLGQRRCPTGYRLVLGRRQRRLPRVDGQPAASRSCWASSSRTWCSPRSSTRSCTRSPC